MITWQRIATAALGVGTVVAGLLITGAQPYLLPIGIGLATWAIPHVSDLTKSKPDKEQPK